MKHYNIVQNICNTVSETYTSVQLLNQGIPLIFVSPQKQSDFHPAERTGLLWRSVNNSPIWYENHYAPIIV